MLLVYLIVEVLRSCPQLHCWKEAGQGFEPRWVGGPHIPDSTVECS